MQRLPNGKTVVARGVARCPFAGLRHSGNCCAERRRVLVNRDPGYRVLGYRVLDCIASCRFITRIFRR